MDRPTIAELAAAQLLANLGVDLNQPGLKETPRRLVGYLNAFCAAHPEPKFTMFPAESDGMVVLTNIPFTSMCEHHCAPFAGTATIGYLPHQRIAGLSKLPRLLHWIAQRMQTQERITKQVAVRLSQHLNCPGAGVILRAQHTCMSARGVRVHDTWTVTTELLGCFKSDPTTRAEFMAHHNHAVASA